MKRIIAAAACLIILLSVCSCAGVNQAAEPVGTGEYCTVTVDCRQILSNINLLSKEKLDFVPKSGYILKDVTVQITAEMTAFDALKAACGENGCHDGCEYCSGSVSLEYSFTPAYSSYYVEGIHQLYEMDCGSSSGWLYTVNGELLPYASSACQVKAGDKIEFVYSVDGI